MIISWLGDFGNSAGTALTPITPHGYARLSKLKNAAIVSDINSSITRAIVSHKKGINVLYASGGAKFVPLDARTTLPVKPDPTITTFTPTLKELLIAEKGSFQQSSDGCQDCVWMNLDRN
jgi:hypothetical protein